MKLLSIDELVLADLGIQVTLGEALLTDESESREWDVRSREGIDGPVFLGTVAEPSVWAFVLACPNATAYDAVISVLTSETSTQRRLLGELLDAAHTRVIANAAPQAIRQLTEFSIAVDFAGEDSVWTDETETANSKTFTSALDQAMPITVPGNTATSPRIVLIPIAQRTTQTAAVGYKWRRRFTVVNNGDDPFYRLPLRIDLGSTTAHVTATRALASGNDVRLVASGIEQQRSLVTWNTAASYLWFNIANLQPGESQTFDIISGNPSAIAASDFAYPNVPAFTLASSSNALWVWPMGTSGLGSWYASRSTAPAGVDFTIPGAWRRILTNENPDNPDWTYVAPYHPPDALVGAAIIPKFRSERNPAKYAGVLRSNPFDGVAIYHPLGITSFTANFQWTNPNTLGALVILARESAAEPWTPKYQYTTIAASATAVAPGAQAFSPAVQHIACAVWPANGWEMPPDSALVGATAWWDTSCQMAIDTTDLSITVEPAWTEVYEYAATLRYGGGSIAVPPYQELLVGNADSADGAGTPRATTTLTQGIVIDCAKYTQEVWSVTAGEEIAFVEDLSAHVVAAVEGWDG